MTQKFPYDPVFAHDCQAQFYKYRAPYLKRTFSEVAGIIQMGKGTRLLDLCCGGGQLAIGFSKHVGHIMAVDASSEMLKCAPAAANIDYIRADVNSPQLFEKLGAETFDHFSIGRAIMFLEDDTIATLTDKYLNPRGDLLVMASGWSRKTEWFQVFLKLRQEYGLGGTLDVIGTKRLSNLGFEMQQRVIAQTKFSCDISYLVGQTLSYASAYDCSQAKLEDFKSALSRALKPYIRNGKLLGTLSSWAVIHRARS